MEYTIHTITLKSDDMDEWNAFNHIIGEMTDISYVIDVLEHYDLENWL